MNNPTPETIIDYWFADGMPPRWFKKDDAFDAELRERFADAYETAASGGYDSWRESAEGTIALVLLLDQIPRNIFRDTPKAFEADAKARELTQRALTYQLDQNLSILQRMFLYMPLMHSESLEEQEQGVQLFTDLGREENIRYAIAHRDVIAKYGRFPHRNAILGRTNTPEEEAYLAQPGTGF